MTRGWCARPATPGSIPSVMLATVALAACAHLQQPQRAAPAPAAAAPAEPPARAAGSEPAPPESAHPESAQESPGTPVAPPCMPAAAGKADTGSQSEVKQRPKSVKHSVRSTAQPAPPQLATAPGVERTPPGGVVDAQVKPMPVAVMSILGKRVQGPKGEDMGRVVDVLADSSGRVRVAIIDFGGFLGVGDRRIAVDWPLLRFGPDTRDPSLILGVSRDKLQAAPVYKDDARPQTLMEPAPATPAADTQP